jgi:hypothetical protein
MAGLPTPNPPIGANLKQADHASARSKSKDREALGLHRFSISSKSEGAAPRAGGFANRYFGTQRPHGSHLPHPSITLSARASSDEGMSGWIDGGLIVGPHLAVGNPFTLQAGARTS